MPVDEHHFLVADSYSSPVFDHSLVMSFADARHSFSGPSPPNSSVSSKSSMFSIPEHSVDSSDITDPSRDQYTRHGHFADSHHPLSSLVNHSAPQLTLNPAHLTNHSAHASTNRVLTRAQARVLLAQQTDQDSMQAHGLTTNTRKSEINANGFLIPGHLSRPHTPPNLSPPHLYTNSEHLELNIKTEGIPVRPNMGSPPHPSTPASTSSSFSHFGFHPYGTHSRSTSGSTTTYRSTSPAMSVMSAATSLSSSSSGRFPPYPASEAGSPLTTRSKQKKHRLLNQDRKDICVYSQKFPHARQEDIAITWGVERSTISKILKHKEKWLAIPAGEELKVAKHRPSKFPEIEIKLREWLQECKATGVPISDNMIRLKAKDAAKELGVGEDKFKASAGWVENFKHRHGIRRGIWTGDGRSRRSNLLRSMPSPAEYSEAQSLLQPETPSVDTNEMSQEMAQDIPEEHEGNQQLDVNMDMNRGLEYPLDGHHPQALEPSPIPPTAWVEQHSPTLMLNPAGMYGEACSMPTDMLAPPSGELNSPIQHLRTSSITDHLDNGNNPSSMGPSDPDNLTPTQPSSLGCNIIFQNGTIQFTNGAFGDLPASLSSDFTNSGVVSTAEANSAIEKLIQYAQSHPEKILSEAETNLLLSLKQKMMWSSDSQNLHHDAGQAVLAANDDNGSVTWN